jgi:hypothetical protein
VLETGLAQLRFAASLLFGASISSWSLDRLVEAALDGQREFGVAANGADGLVGTPPLDEATRHDVQLRGFRTQACRAVQETRYYAGLAASVL